MADPSFALADRLLQVVLPRNSHCRHRTRCYWNVVLLSWISGVCFVVLLMRRPSISATTRLYLGKENTISLALQSMQPASARQFMQHERAWKPLNLVRARHFQSPVASAAPKGSKFFQTGEFDVALASSLHDGIADAEPALPFSRRAAFLAFSTAMLAPRSVLGEAKLPPVDPDPNHCKRIFEGNMEARASSEKLLDLRQCDFKGAKLTGKTFTSALVSDSNFKGADMKQVTLSKSYGRDSDFSGVDFSSATLYQSSFDRSKFVGTTFDGAVLTGTTFEGADLTDATFEDAVIGQADAKKLCANPTLTGDARDNLGCRR